MGKFVQINSEILQKSHVLRFIYFFYHEHGIHSLNSYNGPFSFQSVYWGTCIFKIVSLCVFDLKKQYVQ